MSEQSVFEEQKVVQEIETDLDTLIVNFNSRAEVLETTLQQQSVDNLIKFGTIDEKISEVKLQLIEDTKQINRIIDETNMAAHEDIQNVSKTMLEIQETISSVTKDLVEFREKLQPLGDIPGEFLIVSGKVDNAMNDIKTLNDLILSIPAHKDYTPDLAALSSKVDAIVVPKDLSEDLASLQTKVDAIVVPKDLSEDLVSLQAKVDAIVVPKDLSMELQELQKLKSALTTLVIPKDVSIELQELKSTLEGLVIPKDVSADLVSLQAKVDVIVIPKDVAGDLTALSAKVDAIVVPKDVTGDLVALSAKLDEWKSDVEKKLADLTKTVETMKAPVVNTNTVGEISPRDISISVNTTSDVNIEKRLASLEALLSISSTDSQYTLNYSDKVKNNKVYANVYRPKTISEVGLFTIETRSIVDDLLYRVETFLRRNNP